MISTTLPDELELSELSARFETAPAGAVVRWAWERFGPDGLVMASSFQDCVLIDVVATVAPGIEVVFLDTGFHFSETMEYLEQVRDRYDLKLRVVGPVLPPDEWPCGTAQCCQLRKVEPLNRVLEGRQAWMTGLRRAEADTRTEAPIVAIDAARGVVKVNPLATWSDLDVEGYERDHDLPRHPLREHGYLSIGCAPTTAPVTPGEDARAGRWRGSDKTECGIHL
ncbi:MAG TPA: phosphoadenylyl-sulfate reductase [Acidimicrobiales bacterium]|nr:phosphoadenylyl-sulfate reductase [Acidimicrobiales bacterium]